MDIAQAQPQKAADLLQALVKAERARPPTDGARFQATLSDAETLLTELSVELNDAKLRADIPSGARTAGQEREPPAGGQGQQITPEIVEALRKQLASGKGGKGLTKEVVDALAGQAKQNRVHTGATTPAQKPASGTESSKGNAQ
jgi:hypothetical protein